MYTIVTEIQVGSNWYVVGSGGMEIEDRNRAIDLVDSMNTYIVEGVRLSVHWGGGIIYPIGWESITC